MVTSGRRRDLSALAADGGEEAGAARADAAGGSKCASRTAGAARGGAPARNRRRGKLFAGLATALRGLQVVCVESCLAFQRLSMPSPSPAPQSVTQSVTAPPPALQQQQQRSASKGIGMPPLLPPEYASTLLSHYTLLSPLSVYAPSPTTLLSQYSPPPNRPTPPRPRPLSSLPQSPRPLSPESAAAAAPI
jgi:hypothetical protein